MAKGDLIAETVELKGQGGFPIRAYVARPAGDGPFPGVLVAHHMPGWDEWSFEVTRRFAHNGYAAICPNVQERVPDLPREQRTQYLRERGGLSDEEMLGDLQAGLDYLLSREYQVGRTGVIGFCSGGRVAYMVGCRLDVHAAVDCWGGNVIVSPEALTPSQPQAVINMTPDLKCPLLGIFGNDDRNPDVAQVNNTEVELKKHGKQYEFHRYDGAGHAFFTWERSAHRPEQAADSWQKIFAFYEKHLA
jgi:carboxymethylenebutenolidase